ncbi:MAG: prepilin peptidase [Myxococcales bacterium]|jgi:leader peptidase (prepilin peptidase)/N-methyltransferase|nr:prepilin peptidase [Myxococcales bacterium]MBL0195394.1 prepilin peptidase [Myxococcales bacterium]HQY59957.1 prepilin peptidase [Polyangiaceae bacterium]
MSIALVPPWFFRLFGALFGLLWGSFLNVVIHRVPRELSVVTPPSHCPACKTPIKPWRNIPVLSWFLMGGKAACCGVKVSPRYPLVELIGGGVGLALAETCILQHAGDWSLWRALAVFGATFAVALALVAAAFIDLDFMYIPDAVSIGGAVVGAATATLRGFSLIDAVASGLGSFVLLAGFDRFYRLVRGRSGLGMGDWKLLMLAGAWFGWRGAFFVLLAGSVQGSLTALGLRMFGVKIGLPEGVKEELRELREAADAGDEEAKKALEEDMLSGVGDDDGVMQSPLAFGPFLVLAWFEFLFLGDRILRDYDGWLRALFG